MGFWSGEWESSRVAESCHQFTILTPTLARHTMFPQNEYKKVQ